jgi:hypothetical protein
VKVQSITIPFFSLLQSKEMPRKTRKVSRRHRRKTLRRIPRRAKKGGADPNLMPPNAQDLKIPSSSFGAKIGAPVNSDNAWYKIA